MFGEQSPSARPDHPEPVRFVDDQQRAAGPAHRVQLAERGERAVDGVHAVGDDERALLCAGGEQRVDGGRVVARGHGDAGPGEPAGVDERGVVGRIRDDERARPGERGDDAEVGEVAGGEHEGRRGAEERGELVLQLGVQRRRPGDEAGPGRARAPGAGRRDRALEDPRVGGQAEVVVAREVEQAVSAGRGRSSRRSPAARRRSAWASSQARGCGWGSGTAVTLGAAAARRPPRSTSSRVDRRTSPPCPNARLTVPPITRDSPCNADSPRERRLTA